MRTDTDSERQFATDLGYLHGNGPEIRHHMFNMAQEIDQLRLALAAEREACCEIVNAELDDNGQALAIQCAIRARAESNGQPPAPPVKPQ